MNIGIVGCGYISAMYLRTIQKRSNLRIVGVTDLIRKRADMLAKHANCPVFESPEDLVNNASVDIVVNLTNPKSHYAINRLAILAGKHVYCEKPLATDFEDAQELVALAERKGIKISGAPCSVLSEVSQAVWKELRMKTIGSPRLVYAELDDGMIHKAPYHKWLNEFGIPWPAKDEFEVGCTLEHAGYYLTWLAAFFGPAKTVTRFGATTIPDKNITPKLEINSPDFTVACIRFHSGVIARLTCSIVAPHDHHLHIVGDKGVITVEDCWNNRSRAGVKKLISIRRRTMLTPWRRPVRLPPPPVGKLPKTGAARMDFSGGIAELADAIRFDRESRLSPAFCLHTNELALAIHSGEQHSDTYEVKTFFTPVEPMPWVW